MNQYETIHGTYFDYTVQISSPPRREIVSTPPRSKRTSEELTKAAIGYAFFAFIIFVTMSTLRACQPAPTAAIQAPPAPIIKRANTPTFAPTNVFEGMKDTTTRDFVRALSNE